MSRFPEIVRTRAAGLVAAALVAGALVGGGAATGAASAAAVPAKVTPKTDPCSVLTDADLAGLSTSYSISSKTSELEGTCTYYLEHDGGSTPVLLSVESSIGYAAQKAVTKHAKKVAGLSGGYVGTLNGANETAYKTGKAGIRLSNSDVSSADLVTILKAIHQRVD
jgi:hypothetical protein